MIILYLTEEIEQAQKVWFINKYDDSKELDKEWMMDNPRILMRFDILNDNSVLIAKWQLENQVHKIAIQYGLNPSYTFIPDSVKSVLSDVMDISSLPNTGWVLE